MLISLWLIILLGILVLGYIYMFTNLWQNEAFKSFVQTFSFLTVLIAIISFYYNMQSDKAKQKNIIWANFLADTQKNWIDLEDSFQKQYPFLVELYAELYPNNPYIVKPALTAEQVDEDDYKSYHMCQRLFQTCENIVNTQDVMSNKSFGWYQIFLSWSKSPMFKKYWAVSKQFYNPVTQKFIDNMIAG